jgi:hypothetical protein
MKDEHEQQTDYQAEIDFKMVDEWTRTVSYFKGSFSTTDLVIGGNIFKFYKETMMDKTGCGLSPTGGYDSPGEISKGALDCLCTKNKGKPKCETVGQPT